MFEVGDKVVCVDDSPEKPRRWRFEPCGGIVLDTVYVVRGHYEHPEGQALYLVGVFGGVEDGYAMESGWKASRFRKLSDMQNEARERQRECLKA